MTWFRLARQELLRFLRGHYIRPAGIIALMLVPSLYGTLYLWSNWDPYGRLHRVPVAVVNADRPVRLPDGTRVAGGQQLTQTLLKGRQFDWRQVSAAEADRGIERGDYLFGLDIPADFSKRLASPASGHPQQARLNLDLNDANGFIISKLSELVGSALQAQIDQAAFTSYSQAALSRAAGGKSGPQLPTGAAGIESLAKSLGNPVAITSHNRNPAGVYGVGLAPFLLSIGLWVFGIAVYEILRPLDVRALGAGARPWQVALGGLALPLVMSWIAAGVLLLICHWGLGLDPLRTGETIGIMVLGASAFTAISHFLRAWLGIPGALLSLVLLMVQLTSCGGLYPVQTTPAPFRWLHTIVPMRYLVDALRVTLSGGHDPYLWRAIWVLLAVFLGFVLLLVWHASSRRTWTHERLHPAFGHF